MDPNVLHELDRRAHAILADFVPDTVFDAHAHLYDESFTTFMCRNKPDGPFACYNMERYQRDMQTILPGRTIHVNIMTYPDKHMAVNAANRAAGDRFTAAQLDKDPLSVGEIIVSPGDTVEELERHLIHPRLRGLKCYHLLARQTNDTAQCGIEEYMPEAAWELANQKGLYITLHLMRDASLSDPGNLAYIKTMAARYPNAILILAHAARAFACWTGVEAVEQVAHLDNVWFDFSAVCESPAIFQIINKAGPSRCMWGTDYSISYVRGKCISLADGFQWLYQKKLETAGVKGCWYIATETLMAVRQACIMAGLSPAQVEDIFYNNAMRLFHGK